MIKTRLRVIEGSRLTVHQLYSGVKVIDIQGNLYFEFYVLIPPPSSIYCMILSCDTEQWSEQEVAHS